MHRVLALVRAIERFRSRVTWIEARSVPRAYLRIVERTLTYPVCSGVYSVVTECKIEGSLSFVCRLEY